MWIKMPRGMEVAPPGGNAFKAIKEAILSVNPGTRVNLFVAQGVYYENNIILSNEGNNTLTKYMSVSK